MSPMYKLIIKTGLILGLFMFLNRIGVGFYAFIGYMIFILIRKAIRQDIKGFINYVLYIIAIIVCRYDNISILWLILLLLIITIIRQKNFKNIIKHPVLFYELCFRKVQVMWADEVINHGLEYEVYYNLRDKAQERITYIELRGIKIEV